MALQPAQQGPWFLLSPSNTYLDDMISFTHQAFFRRDVGTLCYHLWDEPTKHGKSLQPHNLPTWNLTYKWKSSWFVFVIVLGAIRFKLTESECNATFVKCHIGTLSEPTASCKVTSIAVASRRSCSPFLFRKHIFLFILFQKIGWA